MYVIDKNYKNELVIKNSRFITLLFKIEKKEEIEEILVDSKNEYPKATHYCYAYITHNNKKSSDDGEPGGTAGTPILNVLEKEKLTNVLALVIRYFGGIKLGAGGLVRAYSKSISKVLEQVNKIPLIKGYQLEIEFDYSKQKEIDYLLKDSLILEKLFQEKVKYTVSTTSDIYQKILTSSCKINHQKKTLIEQKTRN